MNPEKLTRQQRRALERAEKKGKIKADTLKGSNLSIDNQLIVSEARNKKIKPSKQEQQLWGLLTQFPLEKPVPVDYEDATWNKIEQTLQVMILSENPLFKTRSEYLINLINSGNLPIHVVPSLEVIGTKGAIMGTTVGLLDNQPICGLIVSAQRVLNYESHLMMGFQLTHESIHIQSRIDDLSNSSSDTSEEELINSINSKANNIEFVLPEEARAYAIQSEALIYQFGLGQWPVRGDIVETAAAYIRGGQKSDSIKWQDYVKTEILTYINE